MSSSPDTTDRRARRVPPLRRCALVLGTATAVLLPALGGCSTAPPAAAPAAVPASPAPPGAAAPSSVSSAPQAAPEVNPSGDIPDNQVFVPFTAPDGSFTVSVPEGWARSVDGAAVVFTDNLNVIRLESAPAPQAPTDATATAQDVPRLQAGVPGFAPGPVSTVTRKAGPAVLVNYRATSPPDPVTGTSRTDAVERYAFWRAGREVVLTLSGPVGADNVDPWRTVTDSLLWSP